MNENQLNKNFPMPVGVCTHFAVLDYDVKLHYLYRFLLLFSSSNKIVNDKFKNRIFSDFTARTFHFSNRFKRLEVDGKFSTENKGIAYEV